MPEKFMKPFKELGREEAVERLTRMVAEGNDKVIDLIKENEHAALYVVSDFVTRGRIQYEGQNLVFIAIREHESAAREAMKRREVFMLTDDNWSVIGEAVLRHEAIALQVVRDPTLREIEVGENGETLSHVAVEKFESSARLILQHPEIGDISNSYGMTVATYAAMHHEPIALEMLRGYNFTTRWANPFQIAAFAADNFESVALEVIRHPEIAMLIGTTRGAIDDYPVAATAVSKSREAALEAVWNPDIALLKDDYGRTIVERAVVSHTEVAQSLLDQNSGMLESTASNGTVLRTVALRFAKVARYSDLNKKDAEDALKDLLNNDDGSYEMMDLLEGLVEKNMFAAMSMADGYSGMHNPNDTAKTTMFAALRTYEEVALRMMEEPELDSYNHVEAMEVAVGVYRSAGVIALQRAYLSSNNGDARQVYINLAKKAIEKHEEAALDVVRTYTIGSITVNEKEAIREATGNVREIGDWITPQFTISRVDVDYTLSHIAVKAFESAAMEVITNQPEIMMLLGHGGSYEMVLVGHAAVASHEAVALEALERIEVARAAGPDGVSIAHTAASRHESAALKVLSRPDLAEIIDGNGTSAGAIAEEKLSGQNG